MDACSVGTSGSSRSLIATVVAFFIFAAHLPHRDAAMPDSPARGQEVCDNGSSALTTCYRRQPEGMWVREELQADGTWRTTGVAMSPPGGVFAKAGGIRGGGYGG